MKLAVSNIAWAYDERLDAYALLREHGIGGLEIAPGLLFAGEPDPIRPSEAAVQEQVAELAGYGLELVSMQSLLYGLADAQLFGSQEQRGRFEQGLTRAIDLAQRLGIGNLVFGSPRQRGIPEGMSQDEARAIARDTFRRLGTQAASAGCRIALEPNAAAYGTNYLTDLAEAIEAVEDIGHPAVMVNFDVGALHMNGQFEDIGELARRALPHISHVHMSRPHLGPAPADEAEAAAILAALRAAKYAGTVSIEMSACSDGLETLRRCVGHLSRAAAKEGQP